MRSRYFMYRYDIQHCCSVYMGGFVGDLIRAANEAKTRRQRKLTPYDNFRSQGTVENVRTAPHAMTGLNLTFVATTGTVREPALDLRHCFSGWSEGESRYPL